MEMDVSLILVRHAAPRIVEGVTPTLWTLSDEGRAAAAGLAERLAAFAPRAIVSSPEPKAAETAHILADRLSLTVVSDEAFVEHRRPDLRFTAREEFEGAIREVFERPSERLFGGESADGACRRFEEGLAHYNERPLVVVTHGTVLSVFVSRKTGLDPFVLWSGLKLPEALVLDEKLRVAARI